MSFLETPEGKVYDTDLDRPDRYTERLNKILSKQDYLIADNAGFPVADVAVSSYLLCVVQFFPNPNVDLARGQALLRYMKDSVDRDAYGKVYGRDVQNFLSEILAVRLAGNKKKFGYSSLCINQRVNLLSCRLLERLSSDCWTQANGLLVPSRSPSVTRCSRMCAHIFAPFFGRNTTVPWIGKMRATMAIGVFVPDRSIDCRGFY